MNDNDIDLSEVTKAFEELRNQVDYSTPFPTDMEYINPDFDLGLDPDHFIAWLSAEAEKDKYMEAPTGDYKTDVASMCEYSCLYVAMKLILDNFEGDMKILCGKFGFWEHYWLQYTYKGEKYFIDLTLQQFIPTAPKLAITKAKDVKNGYTDFECDYVDYSQTIEDYCKEKRAFMFYTLPQSVKL